MDMYLPIIFCVAIVLIILIVFIRRKREALTTEQCGLTGTITLPYSAISRFTFIPDKDSEGFAEITQVSELPSDLAARHRFLAQVCDETPGCIAFNSDGYLKSGILPKQAYVKHLYEIPGKSGLFVRKCAVAEELFADLYQNTYFKGDRWLLEPGKYPSMKDVAKNDSISSIKVPVGLKVTVYNDTNYRGKSKLFRHGDYPKMSDYGINDSISSLVVEYDNSTSEQIMEKIKEILPILTPKPAPTPTIAPIIDKVGRVIITDPKPAPEPSTSSALSKIGKMFKP